MASFDRTKVPENLPERYNERVIGYQAWRELISTLSRVLDEESPQRFRIAFDQFFQELQQIEKLPDVCRVFVSHQRMDVSLAERIAYLADRAGFEYWLDVHDPLMRLANRTSLPPVVKSIVIAAIVEMALLNCTHGITVQTAKAQSSSWVPYEFGRAKQRWLVSTQVASWFDNGIYAASTSDYLKLGVCAIAEKEVVCWLADERARYPCPKQPPSWSGGPPAQLPN